MKNLILLFLFLFASCKQAEKQPPVMQDNYQIQKTEEALKVAEEYRAEYHRALDHASFFSKLADSLGKLKQPAVNVVKYENTIDSLKVANNKLGKELLHNKLIIQNAKYYLNIANKNPSQQKFLRGWMNRALNQ